MKKNILKKKFGYLMAIILLIAIGATSFVNYSASDNGSDTSSRSYNITVTIKGCKDMYCLDQCDTCWIAIYRYPDWSFQKAIPYDGSCIYNSTVNASEVYVRLEWMPSCNYLFSGNGQAYGDLTSSQYVEIDPTCQ
ncbi:MAG: hypothetical protein HQ542_13605 [Bacteroidia bacterium]|nr:hypothetical protein [Bacteroidia bacterium]